MGWLSTWTLADFSIPFNKSNQEWCKLNQLPPCTRPSFRLWHLAHIFSSTWGHPIACCECGSLYGKWMPASGICDVTVIYVQTDTLVWLWIVLTYWIVVGSLIHITMHEVLVVVGTHTFFTSSRLCINCRFNEQQKTRLGFTQLDLKIDPRLPICGFDKFKLRAWTSARYTPEN